MRDGAAERSFGIGPFRIGVDELVIVRGVGELVGHRLVDGDPIGDAYFRSDQGEQFLKTHHTRHLAATSNVSVVHITAR